MLWSIPATPRLASPAPVKLVSGTNSPVASSMMQIPFCRAGRKIRGGDGLDLGRVERRLPGRFPLRIGFRGRQNSVPSRPFDLKHDCFALAQYGFSGGLTGDRTAPVARQPLIQRSASHLREHQYRDHRHDYQDDGKNYPPFRRDDSRSGIHGMTHGYYWLRPDAVNAWARERNVKTCVTVRRAMPSSDWTSAVPVAAS